MSDAHIEYFDLQNSRDKQVSRVTPHRSTLIYAFGLSRHYRSGTSVIAALDRVDLKVMRGEFVALMGASGSGKSTLLNLVGALDRPSRGEICVDGLSVGEATEAELVRLRRERIGFVFQSFNLIPTLTSMENVETPMMLVEIAPRERRARAFKLLEAVGLADRAAHKPDQLSGGEKQRVAIARALANRPVLLLADEPTGNLDIKTSAAILDLLCSCVRQQGLTLLLVTHDPQIAARADRIIHLCDGRVSHLQTKEKTVDGTSEKEGL